MKEFGQFLSVDNEVLKVCPDCRSDILPEWTSCYTYEWCPYCGCV